MASTALAKSGPKSNKPRSGALAKVGSAGRRLRDGVRAGAAKVVSAAQKARSLVAKSRAPADSVGNILAEEKNGLEAAALLGLVDNTSIGESVKAATGFVRLSDAAALVALAARGTGLDEGQGMVREAGTAVIKAQAFEWARGIGARAPTAVGNFLKRHNGDGNKKMPAGAPSGSLPKTAGADEGTAGADEGTAGAEDGTES